MKKDSVSLLKCCTLSKITLWVRSGMSQELTNTFLSKTVFFLSALHLPSHLSDWHHNPGQGCNWCLSPMYHVLLSSSVLLVRWMVKLEAITYKTIPEEKLEWVPEMNFLENFSLLINSGPSSVQVKNILAFIMRLDLWIVITQTNTQVNQMEYLQTSLKQKH